MLILSNTALIVYLKRKETIMAEMLGKDSGVYQSEKTKLIAIALLFILSYTVDVVFEMTVLNEEYEWTTGIILIIEELYYLFDPIPILILLLFHWKNFRFVPVKIH